MLVAAAVCPHPPMLVPQVAAGLAAELDSCRAACGRVIDALFAADPDVLVVVGAGPRTQEHPSDARGSLEPFGVRILLGAGDGPCTLPLSLGIGQWLLESRAAPGLILQEIEADAGPEEAAGLGAAQALRGARVAALVMADGSAYPSQTPVGDDGRGTRYDDRIAAALEGGVTDDLLALDPAQDADLWTSGRPALQALAGAQRSSERAWRGRIEWRGSPYGVGYLVASLAPR